MISPESQLFCHLNQVPGSEQEERRLQTLAELGLLDGESVPVFEEATQTAAHFLEAPICILGLLDRERQWFKSAVGLSRIGLMNNLASSRQLPRYEPFCAQIVDTHQVLVVPDATANSTFASSPLVQRYGIRAYLGVPLLATNGQCLGTLAVMGLMPRNFTPKEVIFLEQTARWSMSEFERDRLLKRQPICLNNYSDNYQQVSPSAHSPGTDQFAASSVKVHLISQMTQELSTPLTSILGMTSVLSRGVYGTLTEKQKEYIKIVHTSGQYLLSLVNEIVELGALDNIHRDLNIAAVDIEMLCQQAISSLNQAAQRREQQIQLTVEPGQRIWLLDKDKVRQMLYHLVFSLIQSSSSDSIIRIHVSRKQGHLNLAVWTSHPWLGDGLPQVEHTAHQSLTSLTTTNSIVDRSASELLWSVDDDLTEYEAQPEFQVEQPEPLDPTASFKLDGSRQSLGLLLSRQLAEMHGGSIVIQGSTEEGYRYVMKLPQVKGAEGVAAK